LKFISDTKWLSLITETYLKGLDAHSGGSRALSQEGRRRREPGGPWAGVAGWAECHLGRRGEKTKKKMEWAARMTGPKWKIGFGFDFPILFQGFELKIKGFKYFEIKFELKSN
jgi:hypothetical protein